MSGGGRGGFLGRAKLPFDTDPEIKPDFKPTEIFPHVTQLAPRPLTRTERLHVARYRAFRGSVHEGPLYTVLGDHYRGGNQADPFESMPTYTNKYRKKTRKIPKLDTRPYVLDFFPEELWTTLDSSLEKKVGQSSGVSSRKTLQLSRQRLASELLHEGISGGGGGATAASLRDNANEDGEDQPEEGNEKVDKNDDEMLDRDNGDRDEDDEEEEGEEEEVDDNFEDDEDDMGEDYNAQQHYEEGDEVDDYDAGGGDGGGDDGWM